MRIATDNLPFSRRLVSSATPDALRALASHLEAGDLAAASACLASLDQNLRLQEGAEPKVHVDFTSEPFFQIDLPRELGVHLSARLRDLAVQTEYSEIYLSQVVSSLDRVSENDWTFRLAYEQEEPPRDYEPSGMGGMWDVVVFHDQQTIDSLLEAWEAITRWSAKDARYDNRLYVDRAETERTSALSAREAFDLLHSDAQAWRAVGYLRTPFHRWYGEALV